MAKGNKTKGNNQRLHKQVKRIQFVALISFVLALVATFLMHMTVESLLSHTEGNSLAGPLCSSSSSAIRAFPSLSPCLPTISPAACSIRL